uniref:Uncharacterized protein n=1 Tax=Gracilinema caldarium TaxID=215591 RepID=A0A7C3IFV7_9SPIR
MYSENSSLHRWVVLIPHRDRLKPIHTLQRQLWHSGIWGARLLPPVVFIASTERPARVDTLKTLGQHIRQKSQEKGEGGYIDGLSLGLYKLPGNFCALGLSLSLKLGDAVLPALPLLIPSPILILALQADETAVELARKLYEDLPPFRFRQGAVANLSFTLHEDVHSSISLRWELGKPCWMAHHG